MGNFKYIVSLLLVSLLAAGCGSKKSGGGGGTGFEDDPVNPGPPVTEPSPGGGATVAFTPKSLDVFSDYAGWTLSDAAKDFKVTINLRKYGTYTRPAGGVDFGFGGNITVSFNDNGSYNDRFTSLVNPGAISKADTNAENHQYNLYTVDYPQMGGKPGFHGFFQDKYGSLIIVIDNMNDLGDGQGPSTGSGRIYFKNWENGAVPGMYPWGPLSPTSCWFVAVGPYDCRTWKNGDNVNTKKSIYPESNYTLLGTFFGLDMKKAFGGDL